VPSDDAVMTGRANHWRGLESVGGRLTVTLTEVIFAPHRMNIQREEARWPRSEVVTATEGTSFDDIVVGLADGTQQRFVVFARRKWLAVFNQAC
jgi:hypothetical protein